MQKSKNKIQLITYPDSLGLNLKDLEFVLDKYLKDIVYGVHILPFYPSSSDRGFAPLTHYEVDIQFGNWADIKRISKKYELTVDLIVNHISSQSKYFQDYITHGDNSKYADYFITSQKFSSRIRRKYRKHLNKHILKLLGKFSNFYRVHDIFFHRNGVLKSILKKLYKRRSGNPFLEFRFDNGTTKNIYCTFSADHIDLDIQNRGVRRMFKKTMGIFHEHGIKMIRLDAIAFVGKKRNTNGFFIKETKEFLTWISEIIHNYNMLTLPEVHYDYKVQEELSSNGDTDYVYDFALPVLVLHSIFFGNFSKLKNWIKIRSKNQITILDTHDGIGIVDVEGLLTDKQIEKVVFRIKENGGEIVNMASGNSSNNVDIYQINTTYFSALGANENKYLISRAIQFFVPGIPQVYYVGLFAGKNDEKKLKKTGVGRDVNRHNYSLQEIEKEIEKPIVKKLFQLIKFRNEHQAFNGKFTLLKSINSKLIMRWQKRNDYAELYIDLEKMSAKIEYWDNKKEKEIIYKIT